MVRNCIFFYIPIYMLFSKKYFLNRNHVWQKQILNGFLWNKKQSQIVSKGTWNPLYVLPLKSVRLWIFSLADPKVARFYQKKKRIGFKWFKKIKCMKIGIRKKVVSKRWSTILIFLNENILKRNSVIFWH